MGATVQPRRDFGNDETTPRARELFSPSRILHRNKPQNSLNVRWAKQKAAQI